MNNNSSRLKNTTSLLLIIILCLAAAGCGNMSGPLPPALNAPENHISGDDTGGGDAEPPSHPTGIVYLFLGRPRDKIIHHSLTTGLKTTIVESDYIYWIDVDVEHEKIAFASGTSLNLDIWTVNADGTNARLLYNGGGVDSGPAWSPDGDRIAFSSTIPGQYNDIYVIAADGTGLTRVTSDDFMNKIVSWSPDGSKIVADQFGSTTSNLVIGNSDGSGDYELAVTATKDIWPNWSPDGSMIAYIAQTGSALTSTIKLIDPDSAETEYICNPGMVAPLFTKWYVGGRYIAYSAYLYEDPNTVPIYSCDRQTNQYTRLTPGQTGFTEIVLDVSEDGKLVIVGSLENSTYNSSVSVYDIDAGTYTDIIPLDDYDDVYPAFFLY